MWRRMSRPDLAGLKSRRQASVWRRAGNQGIKMLAWFLAPAQHLIPYFVMHQLRTLPGSELM
jgi:hypothetical protein